MEHLLGRDIGYCSLRLVELSFALEELFAFEPDAGSEFPPVGSAAERQAYVADLVAATMPTDDNVKAVLDGLGQPRYPRPARWRWMVNATRGWWEGRCST